MPPEPHHVKPTVHSVHCSRYKLLIVTHPSLDCTCCQREKLEFPIANRCTLSYVTRRENLSPFTDRFSLRVRQTGAPVLAHGRPLVSLLLPFVELPSKCALPVTKVTQNVTGTLLHPCVHHLSKGWWERERVTWQSCSWRVDRMSLDWQVTGKNVTQQGIFEKLHLPHFSLWPSFTLLLVLFFSLLKSSLSLNSFPI